MKLGDPSLSLETRAGAIGDAATVPAIQLRHVTKRFGRQKALHDINLDIPVGQVLALFGPNGAGKSTLLRLLATVSQPTEGGIVVAGFDATRDRIAVRASIGVVGHQTFLYPDLTGIENLRFYARLYHLSDVEQSERIATVGRTVGLEARLHDRVRTYSRGMQQRLALARALLHQPPILLLDEPDSGLDIVATRTLQAIIRSEDLADNSERLQTTPGPVLIRRTVVLSTHDIALGLQVADAIAVLIEGRVRLHCLTAGLPLAEFQEWYSRILHR